MAAGDQYRTQANVCMEAADRTIDPDRRVSLLELAQRWLRLAAQSDATDPGGGLRGDALLDVPGLDDRGHDEG
jgi:hypothetical protein